MRPTIDHSLLSPSGRMSKRARKAAIKRETARLFSEPYVPPAPDTRTRRERLEQTAAGHSDNPSVQAARRLLAKMP